MKIKIPRIIWSLGDRELTRRHDITVEIRPIYYFPKYALSRICVGSINPDYAEPLMKMLSKVRT